MFLARVRRWEAPTLTDLLFLKGLLHLLEVCQEPDIRADLGKVRDNNITPCSVTDPGGDWMEPSPKTGPCTWGKSPLLTGWCVLRKCVNASVEPECQVMPCLRHSPSPVLSLHTGHSNRGDPGVVQKQEQNETRNMGRCDLTRMPNAVCLPFKALNIFRGCEFGPAVKCLSCL